MPTAGFTALTHGRTARVPVPRGTRLAQWARYARPRPGGSGRRGAASDEARGLERTGRLDAHERTVACAEQEAVVDEFGEHVSRLPGVLAAYNVSGADDFLVHLVAQSPDALRGVVLDHLSGHPGVVHVQTSLIFRTHEGRRSLPAPNPTAGG